MYTYTHKMLAMLNQHKPNTLLDTEVDDVRIEVNVVYYDPEDPDCEPEVRVYLQDGSGEELELNMRRDGEEWTYVFGSDESYETIEAGLAALEEIAEEQMKAHGYA